MYFFYVPQNITCLLIFPSIIKNVKTIPRLRQTKAGKSGTNQPCCKQLSIPQEDIKLALSKIKSYMFPQYICLLLQLDVRVFKFFEPRAMFSTFFLVSLEQTSLMAHTVKNLPAMQETQA